MNVIVDTVHSPSTNQLEFLNSNDLRLALNLAKENNKSLNNEQKANSLSLK